MLPNATNVNKWCLCVTSALTVLPVFCSRVKWNG